MSNYIEIKDALSSFFEALFTLRRLGVTPNNKDFTSQLGEWLVSELYDGIRAESGIQKDWDIKVLNDLIQVKTHAKNEKTKARWSAIKHNTQANVNFVIIIVFSSEYRLKEFYKVPWTNCLNLIRNDDVLMWSSIEAFKIPIDNLPKQDLVSLFR